MGDFRGRNTHRFPPWKQSRKIRELVTDEVALRTALLLLASWVSRCQFQYPRSSSVVKSILFFI